MSETSYHMVHYREFKPEGLGIAGTLEELVRKCLSAHGPGGVPRWEAISDRLMSPEGATGFELLE